MPKVSVIIPTYNRPGMLRSAIESVLNQEFQDFNIIVVDDASTHGISEVIGMVNDKRIKHIVHESNKGEAAARNTGIIASDSEYIAFLDDDDEWLPEKLKLQASLLDEAPSETGVIYTGWLYVDLITKKIINYGIPLERGNIYRTLLIKNIIFTPSVVMLRRKCLEVVGLFDEKIEYGTDYDLWLRISGHFDFECIEKPLVHYQVHEHSLTNDLAKVINGYDALLHKYPGLLDLRKYGNRYFSCGVKMCLDGDMKNGMRSLIKSLKLNPFEIRILPYILSGFFGVDSFKKYAILKKRLKKRTIEQAKL